MSRYDDENEYTDDEHDSPGGTDSLIRELRAENIRLEAQLDQLTASVRERTEECVAVAARRAELEAVVELLRARRRRDTKLLLIAWIMVVASLALSLTTYFAS